MSIISVESITSSKRMRLPNMLLGEIEEPSKQSRFLSFEDRQAEDIKEMLESLQEHAGAFDLGEAEGFSNNIMKAFKPLRWLMRSMMRFPLKSSVSPTEGIYVFTHAKRSCQTFAFYISGLLCCLCWVLVVGNMVGVAFNYPRHQRLKSNQTITEDQLRLQELSLMWRNIVPMITIFTTLTHTSVGFYVFFKNRKFAAKCFTFWMEAAGLLRMDLAEGLYRYMLWLVISFVGLMIILIGFSFAQLAPVAGGYPAMMTYLLGRFIDPNMYDSSNFYIWKGFASVILYYVLFCSKLYALLFLFQCRLLTNAFYAWNERLDRTLYRGEDHTTPKEKSIRRLGFKHLFQDHVCLLDMVSGADILFSNAIETFYFTQIFSIVFELYHFVRSAIVAPEFASGLRELDIIWMGTYVLQSSIILYAVTAEAGAVGQIGMTGLEILRRKGYMGHRTDEDLYFFLSMFMSFNGHFETAISAGKYFVFDNGFVLGVWTTVFLNFIILLQFTPVLEYYGTNPPEARFINETRISYVEGFEGKLPY